LILAQGRIVTLAGMVGLKIGLAPNLRMQRTRSVPPRLPLLLGRFGGQEAP